MIFLVGVTKLLLTIPKGWKRWLFMTEEESLINLRCIPIVRHPKLQITQNPFIDKDYFDWRKKYLRNLVAA
ncbi:RNA-directed DNA polymerase [Eubacterium barkeri]|uniref:RNA-directed DNA polymerase n=1 Tax=Eubacterium barkeri TaxID=1528 RepID=A0A1H3K4Q7_EUBBA|nr:RNA-directed DNA polymerase [Eubacterium barkeri]